MSGSNSELADYYKRILQVFYSVLKAKDGKIRLGFFTGVSLADSNGLNADECYAKLKDMYDRYHFCEDSIGIYNPFSILSTFFTL